MYWPSNGQEEREEDGEWEPPLASRGAVMAAAGGGGGMRF